MKIIKKLLVCVVVFLMFSCYGMSLSLDEQKYIEKSDISPLLNGGHLEIINGVKILYINGSNYEMGYQHGFLLKNETQEVLRAFIQRAKDKFTYEALVNLWNITQPYIPSCYIEEMQGIADGANVSFDELGISYMTVVKIDVKCFTYAAWADATEDGNLYHVRSLDFPVFIKDPITGRFIQENSVLIVREPDNGLKSLCPSIAGWINFYQGINEEQVSIGVQVCWSNDQTLKGIPTKFKVQKILDSAEDAEDAIEILTSNKTLGWNYILSDSKKNIGYAIETSANHSYIGTWNNSVEGKYPFWNIKNVVRRGNFFIEPTLVSTQRTHYNPGGIIGFLKLLKGYNIFVLWRKYRAMSMEIEKEWGEIDFNSSISIIRKVYSGITDMFLFIFVHFYEGSLLCDFHQWSACPETGNFVISFADADSYAYENQLHYFNLNELFKTNYK